MGSLVMRLRALQERIRNVAEFKLIESLPPDFANSYSVELIVEDQGYKTYRLYLAKNSPSYVLVQLPLEKTRWLDPPLHVTLVGGIPPSFADQVVLELIDLYLKVNN
jgi:hypothetical protein